MCSWLEGIQLRALCHGHCAYQLSFRVERTVLTYFSFLLVRHPTVLQRLREEIAAVVEPDEALTRAHLAKIPYLKCVLSESKDSFSFSLVKPFTSILSLTYLPFPSLQP